MNREIIFKAKRKDSGEWVEGHYQKRFDLDGSEQHFIFWSKSYTVWECVEIDSDTLCQYTGLTDKNGQKIWENDIVSNEWCFSRGKSIVKFGEYKDYHMPERYQCGNYGFFLEHMHQNDFGVRKDILYFSCKCEVVGNIFDDADLLEVEG